jgi:hypothetical protein
MTVGRNWPILAESRRFGQMDPCYNGGCRGRDLPVGVRDDSVYEEAGIADRCRAAVWGLRPIAPSGEPAASDKATIFASPA